MARCMLCSSAVGESDVVCPLCGGAVEGDPADATQVRGLDLTKVDPSPPTVVDGPPEQWPGAPLAPTEAWAPQQPWAPAEPWAAAEPWAPPSAGATAAPSPSPDGSPDLGGPAAAGPPPGAFGPPGYGAPPEAFVPPGAFGPSTGYGSQSGYGAPQGYGAPPGYVGPQGYGAPQGYGTPQGYGVPPYGWTGYATPPVDGLAIGSLVTSIAGVVLAGFFFVPLLACPVGAVMGHMALRRIDEEHKGGRGLALAGVIIGWIGSAFLLLGATAVVAFVLLAAGTA